MPVVIGKGRRGTRVQFEFRHRSAFSAALVGDFNDWNPRAHPMERREDDLWAVEVDLPPARYEYKFLVDGVEWWNDPDAPKVPNVWGSENSYVQVPDRA